MLTTSLILFILFLLFSWVASWIRYFNNLNKRLEKHNSNLGAKSTKGYKWEIIYKKKFYSKSKALSFEYKLKKDRKERLRLLYEYKKRS